MNVFRGSKRKMILIIAAVIMVMVIIFFVWRGKKAGEPAEIQNNTQNGAGGSFSEYGIGGDREYPEGIIVLEPGDDYNVMLSDRGLLSSEGSLSAVGGALNPPEGSLSAVGGALNPTEGAAAVSAKESASTTTVLVYCIGSDLESENGCATADLREMIESGIGKAKNVNLIIQTGGTKTWKNNAVSAGRLERFRILRDGMYLLEDAEQKSMVDPDTLSEFISWGVDKFPADRMCMIIWGRGGGAVSGIGGDEFHEGSLKLTDIDAAFTKAGVHFDFVGFDASLMGTVETAYMLRSHADNMIASQEAEPGGGWYYTGWLRLLAADPAIGTDILAKQLADDMVRYSATCGQAAALSAVRLDRIQDVYSQICSFLANVKTATAGSDFARIANALSGSGISGDGLYDQTDIVEFALNTGTEGAEALAAAVNDAVIYNNTNLKAANGLSMYFPCSNPGYYSRMSDIMKNIGMDDPVCTDCFEACVSRLSDRSGSLSVFNNGVPAVFEKTGYDCCAITLTEEQRRELKTADAAMYIDDGEGYIVLGCDDLCETGSDNDIMLDFDDTWISIEGQPVCLEVRREGEFADSSRYTYGIVRAELTTAEGTQQDIELVVQWDSKHDEGYVSGYRKAQNRAERSARAVGTQTASAVFPGLYERALRQFNSGDRIRFVYDYRTYSGEFKPYFRTGDEIVFDEELEVSYAETDGLNTVIRIHLVDIYNNEYESEAVKYTFTDEEE